MVRALCCLHNWLIDENDVDSRCNTILPSNASDQLSVMNRGGDFANMTDQDRNLTKRNTPKEEMLDGGDHFDDTDWNECNRHQTKLFIQNGMNPR